MRPKVHMLVRFRPELERLSCGMPLTKRFSAADVQPDISLSTQPRGQHTCTRVYGRSRRYNQTGTSQCCDVSYLNIGEYAQ